MDLVYIDESGDDIVRPGTSSRFVLSAIAVPERSWQPFFQVIRAWRQDLTKRYGIYATQELHATELLAKRNKIGTRYVTEIERGEIFRSGLELLEQEGPKLGLWVTNSALLNRVGSRNYERSTERLINRLQRTLVAKQEHDREALTRYIAQLTGGSRDQVRVQFSSALSRWQRRAILIIDQGHEQLVTSLKRKMHAFNPIASRYQTWADTGQPWKHIPPDLIIGDPFARDSKADYFIQMADFVAHALLRKFEPTTRRILNQKVHTAFDVLDNVLNKDANGNDPQGIVQ